MDFRLSEGSMGFGIFIGSVFVVFLQMETVFCDRPGVGGGLGYYDSRSFECGHEVRG